MAKAVGGLVKGKPAQAPVAQEPVAPQMADIAASNIASDRSIAEGLAAKKNARTRGGSRMLLSDARANAQEGLSATSTLG